MTQEEQKAFMQWLQTVLNQDDTGVPEIEAFINLFLKTAMNVFYQQQEDNNKET